MKTQIDSNTLDASVNYIVKIKDEDKTYETRNLTKALNKYLSYEQT